MAEEAEVVNPDGELEPETLPQPQGPQGPDEADEGEGEGDEDEGEDEKVEDA